MLKVKKCWHHLLWADVIRFFATKKGQRNVKKCEILIKIADIDREILNHFWKTWEISMEFSGKMCLMVILKVTKNHGFILSLEDTFFEKPQVGVQIDSPSIPQPF